jgi:hypothetical protein
VKLDVDSTAPELDNFAPVLGGVALLDEAGKIIAVSAYRFASVSAKQGGGGLTVELRGKPEEDQVVELLSSAAARSSSKMRRRRGRNRERDAGITTKVTLVTRQIRISLSPAFSQESPRSPNL